MHVMDLQNDIFIVSKKKQIEESLGSTSYPINPAYPTVYQWYFDSAVPGWAHGLNLDFWQRQTFNPIPAKNAI